MYNYILVIGFLIISLLVIRLIMFVEEIRDMLLNKWFKDMTG